MRNISFDNPYWLLLAIPLAAALLIPYFISVSKDNRSKGWVASLIIHVLIILCLSLSAAGLIHTTVKTRTKVYVLVDVSYSSERHLDEIDEYVREIEKKLPSRSMMGIVCFGKDTEILTSAGTEIKSVRESKVDKSSTDIAGALDYTASLFGANEIKRIVLITDGFSTTSDGSTAAAVERLVAKGVKLDAIYLDNNLRDGESEAQISDIKYTPATYLNHESRLDVLVESSVENEINLDLYAKKDGDGDYEKISSAIFTAQIGMNIESFSLPTDVAGVFDYKVVLSADKDFSSYNNEYLFTQSVSQQKNVLLITGKRADVNAIQKTYGDGADIDSYLIGGLESRVPYTIEEIVKYDEVILSNVDIRNMANAHTFLSSVDSAVSQYGKSLITIGDLCMRNQEHELFTTLEELLPVRYGNSNKDAKLYTIVIDISRSMYHSRPRQFLIAKEAAQKFVSILEDKDSVCLVTLAGEARMVLPPTELSECRDRIYDLINEVEPTQGTFVGAALDLAYQNIKDLDFEEKQVMLISDGKQYENEPIKATEVAEKMKNANIALSTVSVLTHSSNYNEHNEGCLFLKELARLGGGINYDFLDENKLSDLIFADIAEDVTESVVEEQSSVNIVTFRDETLDGILSVPDIHGFMNSTAKADATMVLSVNYKKSSTGTVPVPLYSYRDHGNGRVVTFNSSLSGDWLQGWNDDFKAHLFGNMFSSTTPAERIDYPFNVSVEYVGESSNIEIIPSSINPKAKAAIKITRPDGSVEEKEMKFNLNRYFAQVSTPEEGRYHVEITYTYGRHSFSSSTYFTLPYAKEYDSFTAHDIVNIYDFMRGVGQISKTADISLENDKTEIDTYELSFRVPLLIAAAALFVIDVIVRKFTWKDILGLFKKKSKEVVAK